MPSIVVGRSTAVTLISNDRRYGSALDQVKRRTATMPLALASTRVQQLGCLGDLLGLHPENRRELSAAGDGVHRRHVDPGRGERVERPGHRADTVGALQQETALLLGELEFEFFRRAP